jgi:hypothetical protein
MGTRPVIARAARTVEHGAGAFPPADDSSTKDQI